MASDDDRRGRDHGRHRESRPEHDRTRRRDDPERHRDDRDDRRRHRSRDGHRRRHRSRTPDSSRRSRSRSRDGERRHRHRHRRRHRSSSRSDDDDARHSKTKSTRSSRSPRRRRDDDKSTAPPVKRGAPLPSQEDSWAVTQGGEPEKPKEQVNYGTTGVLAAASNSVQQADGTVTTLKYHEPPEARKPPPRDEWKLFVFKGGDVVDTLDLGARSCWLVGRDAAVADLPAEHPSISKQHAVIQFRHVERRNEFGDRIGRVRPYLIDLASANGSALNGERVPDSRYLELRSKDMLQFGHSSREYVVVQAPKQ